MSQFKEWFYRFAASGFLPSSLFVKNLPSVKSLRPVQGHLNLEIVSHCWNYSHLLKYQLASLVLCPPQNTQVTFTLFYATEDQATVKLLAEFQNLQIKNIRWNFIVLPVEKLLRRAIGRNLAAKNTSADWVWFTDCDVLFYEGCLDQLGQILYGRQTLLVYPQEMMATTLLKKKEGALADRDEKDLASWRLDAGEVAPRKFSRATGPIQITHGDVARACGYCDDLAYYQQPQKNWSKCYEDRAFRWLLGTQGESIELKNVYWIRHAEKGRYHAHSMWSRIRKFIRHMKYKTTDH